MSDYFTYSPLTANTVARAADVNSRFSAVEAGFDLLPPPQYLSEDRLTFATDTGVANAYISNPDVPITAYNTGLHLTLLATHTNTTISTINVSGLGVKQIIRADGSPLEAGDIVAGQVLDLHYDGIAFRLSMAFAELSPAGVMAKIAAGGNMVVGGSVTATSVIINGQTLDGLTAFGVSMAETANAGTARTLLGLGTMALENTGTYASLASPNFTGVPTAPTAGGGTNTTQIATTAFVAAAVAGISFASYAPLASPALTGTPTAPTAAPGTNTTQLATTAFVAALGALKADLASPTFTGAPLSTTPATADNTTKIATTAYVQSNLLNFMTTATITATYAPLASPALTGNPTATTQSGGNNSTRLATTAFVQGELASYLTTASASATYLTTATAASTYAPLASPAFTGNPTAPTASFGDSDTSVATTAFVQAAKAPNEQTVASSATVTPTFSNDLVTITAQAAALNLANPTGTAVNGWGIVIRIKDNGTARAITYGTQYRDIGVTRPTTTVISKTLYLGMIYNSADTKWDIVSVAQEA